MGLFSKEKRARGDKRIPRNVVFHRIKIVLVTNIFIFFHLLLYFMVVSLACLGVGCLAMGWSSMNCLFDKDKIGLARIYLSPGQLFVVGTKSKLS